MESSSKLEKINYNSTKAYFKDDKINNIINDYIKSKLIGKGELVLLLLLKHLNKNNKLLECFDIYRSLIIELSYVSKIFSSVCIRFIYNQPRFDSNASLSSLSAFQCFLDRLSFPSPQFNLVRKLDLSFITFSFMDGLNGSNPYWLKLIFNNLPLLEILAFDKNNIDQFIDIKVIRCIDNNSIQKNEKGKEIIKTYPLKQLIIPGISVPTPFLLSFFNHLPELLLLDVSFSRSINDTFLKPLLQNCSLLDTLILTDCTSLTEQGVDYLLNLAPDDYGFEPPKFEARVWKRLVLPNWYKKAKIERELDWSLPPYCDKEIPKSVFTNEKC